MSASEPSPSKLEAYHTAVIDYMAGPVRDLLHDPSVTEIMINGPDRIYCEQNDQIKAHTANFESNESLEAFARSILQYAGKRLDPAVLSTEARLPDKSRVHIVLPPASRAGISIAIRKFSKHKLSLDELVAKGSVTADVADLLRKAVKCGRNIVVSGGTGSGKTTLLNVLAQMIPSDQRILVIEDATEIQIPSDRHVLQFEATPPDRFGRGGATIRDLFRASLRMRPDRIVIGECRGGEALDMVQAMNTGHGGSMSTVHANSPLDALARLETLCLLSGVVLPHHAVRAQLGSAIDLIVQIERRKPVRRISGVLEIRGYDEVQGYDKDSIFELNDCVDPSSE